MSQIRGMAPVTGAELLQYTKTDLIKLIKALAVDKSPAQVRSLVDQLIKAPKQV